MKTWIVEYIDEQSGLSRIGDYIVGAENAEEALAKFHKRFKGFPGMFTTNQTRVYEKTAPIKKDGPLDKWHVLYIKTRA